MHWTSPATDRDAIEATPLELFRVAERERSPRRPATSRLPGGLPDGAVGPHTARGLADAAQLTTLNRRADSGSHIRWSLVAAVAVTAPWPVV